jgi:hypothetical protein
MSSNEASKHRETCMLSNSSYEVLESRMQDREANNKGGMNPHGHKVSHIVKNNIHVANPRCSCLQWSFEPIRIAGSTTR